MWNPLQICLDGVMSKGSYKGSKAIYRDELNKKPSPKKVINKADCFGNKERGYESHKLERGRCVVNEEKRVMRVKVKMTKQEAARLMSKCKDGGVLGFKDVANELIQIPPNRVSVVSCSVGGYAGVLNSIPEDD